VLILTVGKTYSCLSYFFNYLGMCPGFTFAPQRLATNIPILDRAAFANAYVSSKRAKSLSLSTTPILAWEGGILILLLT
jgi:hypothetical protein